jgi:putative MATE family efflux protein
VLIYPVGLGVAGAAIGTVVAEAGAAVALLVLGARALGLRGVGRQSLRIQRQAMAELLAVSRNLFLRTASLLTGLLLTTAIAARMGTVVVAAHQIARELWTMLALVLDGFAIAAQAMIATALGAGDTTRAMAESKRLIAWGLAAGVVIAAVYLPLGGVLPGVFSRDAAVLAAVGSVWVIVAALQPVGGIVFVLDGILMGAGDFRFLFLSTAAAALVALVPVGVLSLAQGWGLRGVWAGMAALMLVRLFTIVWRWRTGRWITAGRLDA